MARSPSGSAIRTGRHRLALALLAVVGLAAPGGRATAADPAPAVPGFPESEPPPGVPALPPDLPTPERLTAPETPGDIRDGHARRSIAAGVRYLQRIQQRDGRIGTKGKVLNFKYPVGQTALALLAMLEAGVPPEDPHVRAAFHYAFETPTDHTYEVALQAMVLAKLPKDKLRRGQRRAMEKLLSRLVDAQAADGMWTYWLLDPRRVPGGERGPWGRIVGLSLIHI